MKTTQVVLAAFAVFLLVAVHSTSGLTCWGCNSRDGLGGEECWEPGEASEAKQEEFLVDCDKLGQENKVNYTVCRKIRQEVNDELRVFRSCGTGDVPGPEGRCVERTGTTKIYMTYCECAGDKCNGAATTTVSVVALIVSALAVMLKISS